MKCTSYFNFKASVIWDCPEFRYGYLAGLQSILLTSQHMLTQLVDNVDIDICVKV